MHPLLGVWKLDETVRVVFEILLHTISTLWAEASVSLMLWRAKCSLDHYQYAISIFPEIFFLTSCHKWAVYADCAIPGLGRQWFHGLFQMSPLAIRDMVLRTLLSNLPCKLLFISSIELGLAKKLHQLSLHLIFLYLSLFLSSSISVVCCCYESSFTKITGDVRFLGKRVNTKT